MLWSEGAYTLNLRLDSPVGRGLDTKTGTSTLQDARLPCDKRMVYAAVGGSLDTGSAIELSRSEGGGYKNGHLDFAGCPIAIQQAHGLCRGLRGSGH